MLYIALKTSQLLENVNRHPS